MKLSHSVSIRVILGIAISLLNLSPLQASILNVPSQYSRVKYALNACSPGDTVLVTAGTYSPSTNGEIFPLRLQVDGVQLMGSGIGLSILDAESMGPVFSPVDASGVRVSGFTITGGFTSGNGGGMLIEHGDVEVDNNLIYANGAKFGGSGIFIRYDATPWIHHNVFWENYDVDLEDGDPHGVEFIEDSAGIFEHNLVGRHDSNGLFMTSVSYPTARHNIFFQNGILGLRGRGVCALSFDVVNLYHNLFWDNALADVFIRTDGELGNLTAQEANQLDPADNIFGNLTGDPLLADPDFFDFALTEGSPAIDVGDPSLPGDPDGTVLDIGPYYYDQTPSAVPVKIPFLEMIKVAPNPFNPLTHIQFSSSTSGVISVQIIDPKGRRIRNLFQGEIQAGEHQFKWNGVDGNGRQLPSGLYLALIQFRGVAMTAPMILIR